MDIAITFDCTNKGYEQADSNSSGFHSLQPLSLGVFHLIIPIPLFIHLMHIHTMCDISYSIMIRTEPSILRHYYSVYRESTDKVQ